MFLVGSFLPALYLDQMGRRRPMMWGSFGCAVSMLMIAILLSFADKGTSLAHATSSASVAFFFLVSTTYYGPTFVRYCSLANIGTLCYSTCSSLARLATVFHGRMSRKFYPCMLGPKALLSESPQTGFGKRQVFYRPLTSVGPA